jgi:hypothetical protein
MSPIHDYLEGGGLPSSRHGSSCRGLLHPCGELPHAVLSTWQHWNTLAGGWWSLHSIAAATPGNGVVKSLQDYLAVQPGATIVNSRYGAGGVHLVVGFGKEQDEFDAHVDALTIGVQGNDMTYNFGAGPTSITVEIDITPGDLPNAIDSRTQGSCPSPFCRHQISVPRKASIPPR